MHISFSTAGKPAIIMTKEAAEKVLRKHMDDTRVDLLLMNVLSGRPMTYSKGGNVMVIKAVEMPQE